MGRRERAVERCGKTGGRGRSGIEAAKRMVNGSGGYDEAMVEGVEGRDGVVDCDGGAEEDRLRPREGAIVLGLE